MVRTLAKHKPLPEALLAAAATVADAMGLDSDWLNPGPADLLDHGLPEGFERRITYAAADTGVGRHTEDLEALRPSCEELIAGALWAQSQDPSQEFRAMLAGLLRYFDCEVAVEELGHG